MMRLGKIGIYFRKYYIFWTVCTLLLLVNMLVSILVISRQEVQMDAIQEQYASIRRQSNQKTDFEKKQATQLQAENTWRGFRTKLPPMALVSGKLKEIDTIVQEYDVDAGELRFSPEWVEALALWRYSAKLNARGQYPEMKRLLAHIQNSVSFFCIEQLSLSRLNGQGDVDLNLRIATYCR